MIRELSIPIALVYAIWSRDGGYFGPGRGKCPGAIFTTTVNGQARGKRPINMNRSVLCILTAARGSMAPAKSGRFYLTESITSR